MDNTKDAKK